MANLVIAQMLFLEAEDPDKDITSTSTRPGGSVTAGLAIYDTMQYVKPDVATICMGQAASMGGAPAGGGRQGQALRPAQLADHDPPAAGGRAGQATDIEIQAREILSMRDELNKILAKHTGQPVERIEKDTDRDFFMTAEQAKEYGLVDQVIVSHSRSCGRPRRRATGGAS